MRFQSFAPPPIYVDSPELVERAIQHCMRPDQFLGVDTETLGKLKDEEGNKYYNMTDQVLVMGLSPDENTRYLVPRKSLHHFRPVLEADTGKALSNVKFDAHRIKNTIGADLKGAWTDTVHMDWMIDEDTRENRHGLKECMRDYFDVPMMDYKDLFGREDPRAIVPGHAKWDQWLDYGSLDPWASRKLAIHHLEELGKQTVWEADEENDAYTLANMYWDTEEAQLKCLFGMERRGIKVDKERLREVGARLEEGMEKLAKEINQLVGYPINPASTQQMGKYFFEVKGYTPLSYTPKTRAGQVNDPLFEHLAFGKAQDPVAQLVMNYKELHKLNGTYVNGLLKFLFLDGRIHTDFSAHKVTGRLGSANPNLQNIPQIREGDPYRIREMFIPELGHSLLIVDYSQLEMRIIADMSGDQIMIDAITNGLDMHSFTASKVLNMAYEDFHAAVKKQKEPWAIEQRTAFKKTGFGILYGSGAQGLAAQLSKELKRYVSKDEAQVYINQYLGTFPGVRQWINMMHYLARTQGYVQTMCGRPRRLSKAKYGRGAEQGRAERQSQNAPIQGSAADIVKRAMLYIDSDEYLKSLGWKLLLQVHDELLLEGPQETAEEAAGIVRYYMENPISPPMAVPLIAEPKIARSWAEK